MIDLRSDTVTQPTESMRKAIYDATLGDDVSREDPTVNRLEEYAAELMGKEAALLVPSGTFANQLALLTLAPRGSEVYLADDCHIVAHEAGASAVISGTQLRCIDSENPWLTWHEIEGKIRKNKDIHYPAPGLIEVENALGSGVIYPLEELVKIYRGASQWGIPLHMDGARIFNAALASGIEPRVIARNCDTMMFCLSKGLAAPVGSLLLGEKATIEEARYNRKIMGGGMRQAGIIAAAGLVALNEELPRLKEDHQKAKELAELISQLPPFQCDPSSVQINMVFMSLKKDSLDARKHFLELLEKRNILTYDLHENLFRFVFHRDIDHEDFKHLLKSFREVAELLHED